jgi:hypothetical protein
MRIRPYSFWPIILGFPLAVLAGVIGHYAILWAVMYGDLLTALPQLGIPFLERDIEGAIGLFARVGGGAGVVLVIVAFLMLFLMRGWVLWLYRKCCIVVYVLLLLYVMLLNRTTGVLIDANVLVDGNCFNPVSLFFLRWHLLWSVGLAALGMGLLHVMASRRRVISLYTGIHDERPAPGDIIVENILSNGSDPRYRKSWVSSIWLHVLVLLVIPWLLSQRGCVESYKVPQGSGKPQTLSSVVPVQKMIKKQKDKKKKKKKFTLNTKSAISFHIPDLDESDVARQVDDESMVTYVADPKRTYSTVATGVRPGAGGGRTGVGGGNQGGWPDGMANHKVRLIRLEHGGRGWDDGMDSRQRADLNFLDEFRKLTGFNVTTKTESHRMALLARYPKGYAPPFVFMTGEGDIGVTERDVTALRDYLLGGGMLFADCSSPRFHQSFCALMARTLPGEPLQPIADDDIIFQIPFTFPNGAPPFWHHGGTRALGIKHKGRWAVFYHPGDMHDAWKTGKSGMRADLADEAVQLGVNVVYYSFTHYLELTRKYR